MPLTARHAAAYVLVCCDGTWCGPQMGTQTNTKMLADSFASTGADKYIKLSAPSRGGETGEYYNGTLCIAFHNKHTDAQILYVPGCGLNMDAAARPLAQANFLLDCALAVDIKLRIITAYKFISDHFADGTTKVMLFGHSRGAFTARAVAGMIRNCGILKHEKVWDVYEQERLARAAAGGAGAAGGPYAAPSLADKAAFEAALLEEVYYLYQSPEYSPNDEVMLRFRRNLSHTTQEFDKLFDKQPAKRRGELKPFSRPPVEFMGLLDTVGALGIPKLNDGRGVSYGDEFYDRAVSKDVHVVWQGLAVHDRLTFFQPCHIHRSLTKDANEKPGGRAAGTSDAPRHNDPDQHGSAGTGPTELKTKEVWLPGSHYDVGRQQFILPRNVPGLEGLFHAINRIWNPFRCNVMYDVETADTALFALLAEVWALEKSRGILPADPTTDEGRAVFKELADDKLSWWQRHVSKPVYQDAYDEIAARIDGFLCFVKRLLSPLLIGPALAETLRSVIGTLMPIVLANRHIPLEAELALFQPLRKHNEAGDPKHSYVHGPQGAYTSAAFTTYRRAAARAGTFLDDWGVPCKAAHPCQDGRCSCGAPEAHAKGPKAHAKPGE